MGAVSLDVLWEQISLVAERNREIDAFGKQFGLYLIEKNASKNALVFGGHTLASMKNIAGIVHGGMCAALVDQAMGIVAFCLNDCSSVAPTMQLQISFHRPLMPEKDVLVEVCVENVSKSHINLSSRVYHAEEPEKLVVSSTAFFFRTNK